MLIHQKCNVKKQGLVVKIETGTKHEEKKNETCKQRVITIVVNATALGTTTFIITNIIIIPSFSVL